MPPSPSRLSTRWPITVRPIRLSSGTSLEVSPTGCPTESPGLAETLCRAEHELRAAEERHRPAVRSRHRRVPDLRRPSAVHERSLARDRAFASRPKEVRLQLDRGEAGAALGKAEDAPVTAGRVRECDHRRGMEVTVG